MKEQGLKHSRWLVLGAVCFGFLAGCLVMSVSQNRPAFLADSTQVAQKQEKGTSSVDRVSYYSVQSDWKTVLNRARKELPNYFESDTLISGLRAKVLTVPRIENGRIQLFYPPAQEITFMPRRFSVNHDGHVVAILKEGQSWTGIQVRIYRQPQPFDGLVEWVRKAFKA